MPPVPLSVRLPGSPSAARYRRRRRELSARHRTGQAEPLDGQPIDPVSNGGIINVDINRSRPSHRMPVLSARPSGFATAVPRDRAERGSAILFRKAAYPAKAPVHSSCKRPPEDSRTPTIVAAAPLCWLARLFAIRPKAARLSNRSAIPRLKADRVSWLCLSAPPCFDFC